MFLIRNFSWNPYCYLWYDDYNYDVQPSTRMVINSKELTGFVKKRLRYAGYIFSCAVGNSRTPQHVSLDKSNCSIPTNLLPVESNVQEKQSGEFVVCVKPMTYVNTDFTARFIEWLEVQKAVGARKVFTYVLLVPVQTTKVMEWYRTTGFLDFLFVSLAGSQPNDVTSLTKYMSDWSNIGQRRLNEKLWLTDCFYRHINSYEYVTVCDLDEVIVPAGNVQTWLKMMPIIKTRFRKKLCASYCFRSTFVLDKYPTANDTSIPKNLHMMKHIFRSQDFLPTDTITKCFVRTQQALTVRNHGPHRILAPNGTLKCYVPVKIGYILHYRDQCKAEVKFMNQKCLTFTEKLIKDTTLWKYLDQVRNSVKVVNLQFPEL